MKQIQYKIPSVRLVDIPERKLESPTDVKVKIAYSAICGSDLHDTNGDFDYTFMRPKFLAGHNIGHEASGYVVELGEEATVKGLKVGDKVSLYYNKYCGKCHYCRTGREHLCENIDVKLGFMSEYVVVDEQMVFKIPDDSDMRKAALVEPISVCLHGVEMAHIKAGYSVAVSGAGGVGNLCMQLSKLSGACRLTVFEPNEWKRKVALECGADYVLDPQDPDFREKALAITDGRGFDVIIECSGAAAVIGSCYSLLARGGTLELMALFKPEISLDAIHQFDAMQREITVIAGVFQSPYTVERSVELFNKLNTEAFISAVYEPEDYEEAFKAQREGRTLKSMFKFAE